jgi:hypothetical protein
VTKKLVKERKGGKGRKMRQKEEENCCKDEQKITS